MFGRVYSHCIRSICRQNIPKPIVELEPIMVNVRTIAFRFHSNRGHAFVSYQIHHIPTKNSLSTPNEQNGTMYTGDIGKAMGNRKKDKAT